MKTGLVTAIVALIAVLTPFGSGEVYAGGTGNATSSGAPTVHVRGYTRKDGTYVQPHYRSAPRSDYRGGSVPTVIVVPHQPSANSNPRSAGVLPTSPAPATVAARTSYRGTGVTTAGSTPLLAEADNSAPPTGEEETLEQKEAMREKAAELRLKLATQFINGIKEAESQKDFAKVHRFREAAKDRCKDVISEFPGTNAAGKAKQILNELEP